MKSDESKTGSLFKHETARNLEVPANKPYDKLTPQEQRTAKAKYHALLDGDEPPYPLGGTHSILQAIHEAQSKIMVDAEVSVIAQVNQEGKATEVKVLQAPTPELGKFVAGVLGLTKFKPALCGGEPCTMAYPFKIKLMTEL